MTWCAPIFARVAGGALTEPIGACLLLAVLIGLARVEQQKTYRFAAGAGLCAAVAWFLKYDYGVVAVGTIGLSGFVAVALRRDRATYLKLYGVAVTAAASPIAAWFLENPAAKIEGISQYVGRQTPGATIDFGYYAMSLFSGGEVGLAPLIGAALVGAVALAIIQIRHRPTLTPLICLVLWYFIYSLAANRYPRYLATIVPVLGVFAGLAVDQLVARASLSRSTTMRVSAIAVPVIIAFELVSQASAGSTGFPAQFWWIAPDPAASEAVAFTSSHLRSDVGPVLMLGQTNEFTNFELHLVWTQRLGHPAPVVDTISETARAFSSASFMAAVNWTGAHQIVGVDVRPGSRLDTADYHTANASQATYVALAQEFESKGLFKRVAATSLEDGHLAVIIWVYAGS
jgi:hypothetical protein